MPVYEVYISGDDEVEAPNKDAAHDEIMKRIRNGQIELDLDIKEFDR